MKIALPNLGIGGLSDAAGAIGNMQSALTSANSAATPLHATMSRVEGALHGMAAVARITSAAMSVLPGVFSGLNPAISKTLSGVSLASRAFDALRGSMTPLGGVMAYLEMRNLGVSNPIPRSQRRLACLLDRNRGLAQDLECRGLGGQRIGWQPGARRFGSFEPLGVDRRRGVRHARASDRPGWRNGWHMGPLAAVGGVAGLTAAAFAGLGASIHAAADFETIKTGFVTILGSATAAEQRLRELANLPLTRPLNCPR